MPKSESLPILNYLTRGNPELINTTWLLHARSEQWLPSGDDWRIWLALAGRGFGKTRTGAETVRMWAQHNDYVNLIGATADDARDIMVEGESGILNICSNDDRPEYIANKNLLRWRNGARSLIFTADRPERLRGKQHAKLWMDELAAWRYMESYDQAMMGLRLGNNPQAFISTTPRPIKLIKELIRNPRTIVTRGSTYDNRGNLAQQFLEHIIKKYEGTRLGRQELMAEILEDNPNALWNRDQIDRLRVEREPKDLKRIVVGVDPAVTDGENACETGIIVAGLGQNEQAYILEDCTMHGTADQWAKRAVRAYHEWGADRLVAEVNNGGDLVQFVVRTVDKNVSYRKVHASRGKTKRAEPIAAIYEQGRAHHVGSFPLLEDQMCDWNPTLGDDEQESPDRMDALVWALSDLMLKTYKEFIVI